MGNEGEGRFGKKGELGEMVRGRWDREYAEGREGRRTDVWGREWWRRERGIEKEEKTAVTQGKGSEAEVRKGMKYGKREKIAV